MDHRDVREWLDAAWNEAIRESVIDPDPEVDALVNSDVRSIRYALVTQMLGKIADPTRSLMALQLGAARPHDGVAHLPDDGFQPPREDRHRQRLEAPFPPCRRDAALSA